MKKDVAELTELQGLGRAGTCRAMPAQGSAAPVLGLNAGKRHLLHSPRVRSGSGLPAAKSPAMIGVFLALWLLPLAYYGPRLWHLVAAGGNAAEVTLLVVYCGMLAVFWLFAAHYIAVVLFSFLTRPLPQAAGYRDGEWPEIAILYPTCNDFQPEAALSCLNQDYPSFRLFLLDDSTKAEYRALLDSFHACHPETTTIVRRRTRQGFKAGNLNNALHREARDYSLFAVVDADERLPPNFLRQAVPYLRDPARAFVQASHAPRADQESRFARDIGPTILPFWHVHCRPRNRYGLVVFLGHGVLVRRSAWEAAGAFPEVVTEDLAFTVALAEQGMRGIFVENLVCHEDFPASYPAFKKQQERYLIGTLQVMRMYLGTLLRSRRISPVEKVDFFLWCAPLYVPALVLIFVTLCSLGLAAAFGHWHTPVISILGRAFSLPPVRMLDSRFSQIWSRDFQLLSVLWALAPAFASLALGLAGKLRVGRLLILGTVPYLSLMVIAWRGILEYLFTGRVLFPPTGEEVGLPPNRSCAPAQAKGARDRKAQPGVWRAPIMWEVGIGSILSIASLITLNFALFAVSSCLLLGVAIGTFGWESKFVRGACAGCVGIILVQMVMNVVLPVQASGLAPFIFSVHF